MQLIASADILKNSGNGTQNWGDSVTLTASNLDGGTGRVVYDTEFKDKGFGVAGGRWQQLDYYQERGGRSESLKIDFGGSVSNVVLTVGMMGKGERTLNGQKYDETGKWTAYNSNGNRIASGLLGPELSMLGSGKKIDSSYGKYPIKLNSSEAIASIEIEATGFGHGKAEPNYKSYGENNSDFNLTELNYNRVSYGSNSNPQPKLEPEPSLEPQPEQVSSPPKNNAPVAIDDGIFDTTNDSTLEISSVKLLANDSDADGDDLIITKVLDAQNGLVVLKDNKVIYTPNAEYVGIDEFSYSISDGGGNFDSATVEIDVTKSTVEPPKVEIDPEPIIELPKVEPEPVIEPPKTNSEPIVLKAGDVVDNTTNSQTWRAGVSLSGSSDSQKAGVVSYSKGGFAIAGDRYDYQIDYDALTRSSEKITLGFENPIDSMEIETGFMEANEWNGLNETGKWTAYSTEGREIASGILDPDAGNRISGGSQYSFGIDPADAFSEITIEATAYGNGIGDRVENNSDFNLRGISFVEI